MDKVFILGAGASHGTGFTCYKGIKPPLLKDFFKIFREFNYFGRERLAKELFKFLQKNFGWSEENLFNGEPNLEDVIDAIDEFIDRAKDDKESLEVYRDSWFIRKDLENLIGEALHRTTWQPIGGFVNPPYLSCPYHEEIANSIEVNDFIISLNYDLVMEIALINHKNWDYLNGYGLSFSYYFSDNKWQSYKNTITNSYYFKLHGSLNWFISTGYLGKIWNAKSEIKVEPITKNKLHLLDPILWYRNDSNVRNNLGANFNDSEYRYLLRRLIVGPGRRKSIGILSPLWEETGKRLQNVKEVIMVGCSLRETDFNFIQLLKNNIKWNYLEKFILVDPCVNVKDRCEKLFNHKVDILLNNIKQLAEYLRSYK